MEKYQIIREGRAKIAVPANDGKISSEMPVFYNPVMRSNRDITIALMAAASKQYEIEKWSVADPMAATGIREVRMMLELGSGKFERIAINDYSPTAATLIIKNLALNKIKSKKIAVTVNEANKFLLGSKPFNYADIDPFGYPGTFLDSAVRRTWHNGILAVTATDTSALAGTSPSACRRKYLATPLRNGFMHETGIRMLVRLVQLFGSVHEKAMRPIFCYYKEHYIRAFFHCSDGAGKVDELLKQHEDILYCFKCCNKEVKSNPDNYRCSSCNEKMTKAGPLWTGRLFDSELAAKMAATANKNIDAKTKQFLAVVAEEAKAETKTGVGFYAIEDICEKHHIRQQPKTADVIARLRKAGFTSSQSHCSTTGVKTNASVAQLVAAAKGKV